MGTLDGKVAIVTGASRGLGKDISLGLARAGASVVAVARTETENQSPIPGTLEDTVRLIKRAGGQAVAIRADVSREEDVQAAVDGTMEYFGRLDVLVNNAGVQAPGSTLAMEVRHWDLLFRVNVRGPFLFCRAASPIIARQGGGHIINISSRAAIGPGPGPYRSASRAGGSAYGTTKAALERLSQGLAVELAPRRIAVNALSPHISIWSEGGHFARTRAGGGTRYSGWRMTGDIIGDAVALICGQDPSDYTGRILYDQLVVQELAGLSESEVLTKYPVEP